jgi:hypothetical protein
MQQRKKQRDQRERKEKDRKEEESANEISWPFPLVTSGASSRRIG